MTIVCVNWHGGLEGHRKFGNLLGDLHHAQKGDRREYTNHRGISPVSAPGKLFAKFLDKGAVH